MANYTTLRNGNSGPEVEKLQQHLTDAGYGSYLGKAGIDGIYGAGTTAAVKAYQKANGLSVDGIAGNQTLGKLYGSSAVTTPNTANAPNNTSFNYEEFKYDPYTKSDTVKQAENLLKEHMTNKPGDYTSSWQEQLNDTLNQILNREKFSYDLNGDALYQQYKDQYVNQGKQAMMDTMGQAAAMTGGYGNSYAQTVGQQTYQGHLQQLNDRVPELYQLALSQYNQEGQDLYNQAALMAEQEEQDYNRHRDAVSDYYTDLEYLTGRLDTLSNDEYDRWLDKVGMDYNIHSDKQTAGYQAQQDAYDKAMTMFGLGVTPDSNVLSTAGISSAEAQAIIDKVEEQAVASGSSGSDTGNTGDTIDNGVNGNNDDDKKIPTPAIPDDIKQKAKTFDDNESLASWAYGLADAGVISEDQADQLIAENMDHNEKYITDDKGNSKISYQNMVASSKGWTVIDNGGVNLFGIDANAKVKSPNGETLTLSQLKKKLTDEGMSSAKATEAIKKLQQNLGISSNWFFGL